jgi:hypothetical protein
MQVLYLDLVGGISGDMMAGALVDLGVPMAVLQETIAAAGVPEITLAVRRETRHAIAGCRFVVKCAEATHPHPGHGPQAPHAHRPYSTVRALLQSSAVAPPVKNAALRVFHALAEAEGAVHGVHPETVEFHEVGSWDAIADVLCAAAGLAHLGVEAVYCSPVPLGGGTVRSAHGVLPVPGPATLRLLQGFPVVTGGPAFERTTPTGAAILAALARPAPAGFTFTPERTGIGLGSADPPEVPNLLRAVLCRPSGAPGGVTEEEVELAAANVDNANPEWIGFAMERLLEAGALDVSLLPLQMKKNRPGTQIQVLYPPPLRERMLAALLREVPTLGVRFQTWRRWVLPRRAHAVRTPWGDVAGKVAEFEGRARFSPEFDACRAIALGQGLSLSEVYRAAQRAWEAEQP